MNEEREGVGERRLVQELHYCDDIFVCAGASKRAHSSSPQKVCQTRQL